MADDDALTVGIVQSSVDVASVVESIRGVMASGLSMEIQVVAASLSECETIDAAARSQGLGTPSGVHLTIRSEEDGFDALAHVSSTFLSIVRAGDAHLPGTLERHLRALEIHPEAVVSLCPGDTGERGAWPWPDSDFIDGRVAGRDLLFATGRSEAAPTPILMRTSAIAPLDFELVRTQASAVPGLEPEWLLLTLKLLTRGPAWCDRTPGWNAHSSTDHDAYLRHIAWADAVAYGVTLDLLEPSDVARVFIEHTRQVAGQLRQWSERDPGLTVDDRSALARALIHSWRTLRATGGTPSLYFPLHHPPEPVPDRPVQSTRINTEPVHEPSEWLPPVARDRQSHVLRKFIIAAPPFTEGHGGVVALHRLCDRLNAAGYEAYLELTSETTVNRPDWLTPLRRGRSFNDAVIVYPEVISGNPFNAPRVVRWLLNRPAWFTGNQMGQSTSDLLVTFNRQISSEFPVLEVPLIDPTVFFPKDRPGSGSLLWIGKGVLPPDFDRSDVTLLTRLWPGTRMDLAARLRSARILYSCDWLTSLIDEALMCGTPVALIGEQSWDPSEVFLRPGMALGGEAEFDQARKQVGEYFPAYLKKARSTETSIEEFVTLVNHHFGEAVT